MKIVINSSFGGFGLSARAMKELAKRKSRKCFFFRHPKGLDGGITDFNRFEQCSMAAAEKEACDALLRFCGEMDKRLKKKTPGR